MPTIGIQPINCATGHAKAQKACLVDVKAGASIPLRASLEGRAGPLV